MRGSSSKSRKRRNKKQAKAKKSLASKKIEADKCGYDGKAPHVVEMDFVDFVDGKLEKKRVSRNVNESPAYRLYYRKIIDRWQYSAAERFRFWGEVVAVSPLKAKQLLQDRVDGGNGKPVEMTEMQAEAHQALSFIYRSLKDNKHRGINYQILWEFCVGGVGIEDLAKRHWGTSDYRRKQMSKHVQNLLDEVVDLLEEIS